MKGLIRRDFSTEEMDDKSLNLIRSMRDTTVFWMFGIPMSKDDYLKYRLDTNKAETER